MRGGRWEGWYADGEGDRGGGGGGGGGGEGERGGGGGGEIWLMVPSGAVSKPEPGTKQGDRGKFRRNLDDFSSMCHRLRAV